MVVECKWVKSIGGNAADFAGVAAFGANVDKVDVVDDPRWTIVSRAGGEVAFVMVVVCEGGDWTAGSAPLIFVVTLRAGGGGGGGLLLVACRAVFPRSCAGDN